MDITSGISSLSLTEDQNAELNRLFLKVLLDCHCGVYITDNIHKKLLFHSINL